MLKNQTACNIANKNNHIFYVKLFAIFAMLFDHVYLGLVSNHHLPANNETWLFLGRFAAPIFIILLAYHYVFSTSNRIVYIARLILIGVLSEIPYQLYFDKSINFILAMGIALWAHYIFELCKQQIKLPYLSTVLIILVIMFFLIPQAMSECLILFPLLTYFSLRDNENHLNYQASNLTLIGLIAIATFMLILFYGGTKFPLIIETATILSVLLTFPFFKYVRTVPEKSHMRLIIFRDRQQLLTYLIYPVHFVLLYFIFGSI